MIPLPSLRTVVRVLAVMATIALVSFYMFVWGVIYGSHAVPGAHAEEAALRSRLMSCVNQVSIAQAAVTRANETFQLIGAR